MLANETISTDGCSGDSNIQRAIDCASAVFSAEKEHRIGHSEDMVYPFKVFLFTGADDAYVLLDQPFVGETMAEKDAWSLFVRLMVMAVNAHAVLHVSEGWFASRCDGCGEEIGHAVDCGRCGMPACAPSESKYREEILTAILEERDTKERRLWAAHIVRDESNAIVGYDDETTDASTAASTESVLRFEAWWRLHPWMIVHCYRNLQVVAGALACRLQPCDENMARLASSLLIPGEVHLRVDLGRLEHCIRKVNIAGVTHAA